MNWTEFAESGRQLAVRGEELLRSSGLCLVGTIRTDGSPRISPCEVILEEGELMLGMMWQSRKAMDLRRDPRLVVHAHSAIRKDPRAISRSMAEPERSRTMVKTPPDRALPTCSR